MKRSSVEGSLGKGREISGKVGPGTVRRGVAVAVTRPTVGPGCKEESVGVGFGMKGAFCTLGGRDLPRPRPRPGMLLEGEQRDSRKKGGRRGHHRVYVRNRPINPAVRTGDDCLFE